MSHLNSASSDRTGPTLHKDSLTLDRACHMNRPMRSDAGNAKRCTLLQCHAFGELNHLCHGNHGVLGSSSERAVRLSAVTPHPPTDPFSRNIFSHGVNSTGTIAVRYNARIRH